MAGLNKEQKNLVCHFFIGRLHILWMMLCMIYPWLVKNYRADFVVFSGWLKKGQGLDPTRTVNIHPGPLPEFGGPGMYGHYVHEAVIKVYEDKKISHSAVSMHFVDEAYDKGPQFLSYPVKIQFGDSAWRFGRIFSCTS